MINIYLRTSEGANAHGSYNPKSKRSEAITIRKGSILTIDPYASGVPSNIQQNFDTAATAHKSGYLREKSPGVYEVIEDLTGLSASESSVIVTGKPGSGWLKWKLDDGSLLDVLRLVSTKIRSATISGSAKGETIFADKMTDKPEEKCNALACRFISYLKTRKKAKVNLELENDWLEGALVASAGAGNPKKTVLAFQLVAKNHIKIIVNDFFLKLSREVYCGQSRFDFLFKKTVSDLETVIKRNSPLTSISFGRVQKILNIIIKYCYVWWLCKESQSPCFEDISWVEKWLPYLHVPVDRGTMKHLHRIGGYKSLVCIRGALISWKWKMDEYCYFGVQDSIRKLAKSKNLDPICYEMEYIFIAGK
jgi:hypothetical protein